MQRQRCGLLVPLDVAQQLLGFLAAADRAALRLTAKHMMSASPPPGTVVRVHLATRRSVGAPWLDAKRRAVLTAEAAASSPQRHWRRSATIHTVRLVEYRSRPRPRPRPAVFGLATREPLAFEDDEARALAGWVDMAFASTVTLVVPHWVPACHFGSANVVFDCVDGRVTPGPLWKARHSPTEAATTVMPGGRLTIWEPDEDDEVHDAWLRSIPWIDTQSSVVPASHQAAVAFPGVRTRLVSTRWPPLPAADRVYTTSEDHTGHAHGTATTCLADRLGVAIDTETDDRLLLAVCAVVWPRLRAVSVSLIDDRRGDTPVLARLLRWALSQRGVETVKIDSHIPVTADVAGELDHAVRERAAASLPPVSVRYTGPDRPLLRYLLRQDPAVVRVVVVHISPWGPPKHTPPPLWQAMNDHGHVRVAWLDHAPPHALDASAWHASPHLRILRVYRDGPDEDDDQPAAKRVRAE